MPTALADQVTHQRDLRVLVERVVGDQGVVETGGAQHLPVAEPQPGPGLLGPRLVEVLGEQRPRVERGRCGRRLRLLPLLRDRDGGLEPVDVDVDVRSRQQRHRPARDDDAVAVTQRGAGVVAGGVQPGRGGLERGVGPERVDHLLAVEPVRRLQRQQRDQPAGRLPPPLPGRHGPAVDGDLEATEQPDLDPHLPSAPDRRGQAPRRVVSSDHLGADPPSG